MEESQSAGDGDFWEALARSMYSDQSQMNPDILEEAMDAMATEERMMDLETRIADLSVELASAKRDVVQAMLIDAARQRASGDGPAAATKEGSVVVVSVVDAMSLSELVQSLRQLGNDAFKQGEYARANVLYSAAINAACGSSEAAVPQRVATPYGAGVVLEQRALEHGGALATQLDWTLADGTQVMAYLQPDAARYDTLVTSSSSSSGGGGGGGGGDDAAPSTTATATATATATVSDVTRAEIEARGISVSDFSVTLANRSAARLKMVPPRSVRTSYRYTSRESC